MRNEFFKTLLEEARKEPRLHLLTGDLGFNCIEPFRDALPEQFSNMGICEGAMVGAAAGMALAGLKPFAYSIGTFMTMRCLEQIRDDICVQNADVKIVGVGGGCAYGIHGPTHHAIEDLALMRSLAGMAVLAPADPVEVRLAVRALVKHQGGAYLRIGKTGEPILHKNDPHFEIGKGIVMQEGKDLTFIGAGLMVGHALKAAAALAKDGFSVGVISMHTIQPLDQDVVLRTARATGALITVEEHVRTGGLGSAVSEVLADAGLGIRFQRLSLPDTLQYLPGSQSFLHDKFGLSPEKIAESARALLKRPKS